MKSETGFNHLQKRNPLHRFTALLLCMVMAISLCYHVLVEIGSLIATAEQERPQDETREEIKTRLMRQIKEEGWDPYASDMSLDEFYALMELFEEGTLPLKTSKVATIANPADAGPTIPREMFLFSGLKGAEIPDESPDKPLDYNNITGVLPETDPDFDNYPAGLDPYGFGYQRPPESWKGVETTGMQAVIIKEGENAGDISIAGNVVQSLFKDYREEYGYYVRRVTAESAEVTILGAIKLPGQDKYVYYYLTSDKQENDVSTTTLPEGKKFIIEYSPIEHAVEYQVLLDSTDGINGTDITGREETVNVNGKDITATWEEIIFGADRPGQTDGASYSFTAWAPYGYTVEFYLWKPEEEDVSKRLTLELGKTEQGAYKSVNNGWALGRYPDYTVSNKFTLQPNVETGPQFLTMNGTIVNNDVHHNRTVIAVVTKNGAPVFDAYNILYYSEGAANRGSSAYTYLYVDSNNTLYTTDGAGRTRIYYDYDDHYSSRKGWGSQYNGYKNEGGTGNLWTCDGWGWGARFAAKKTESVYSTMTPESDGTYSWQWTFQTNNGNFLLDSLAINGVSLRVPFLPRYPEGYADGGGTDGGARSWHTEVTLPDGATARLEMLCGFGSQRAYRIIITGARTNVTVTGLNLMQYGGGAPEFVVYDLDGVTGATAKGNTNYAEAIRYYNLDNSWGDRNNPAENEYESNLVINETGKTTGINWNGDPDYHGANICFKLVDGYDSPYFLWESTKGIIPDAYGNLQASIRRKADGTVDYDTMNEVLLLSDVPEGEDLDSQYIYKGDNGWYYIRVSTQNPYKLALLTIIARPVRYVARYIPSYDSVKEADPDHGLPRKGSYVGIVDNPENMPTFSLDNSHESFKSDKVNGEQYDDADGAYYDTAVDDVIRLPAAIPTDSGGSGTTYRFVSWVLVDDEFNPVWAWTNAKGESIQVVTDQYGNRLLVDENGYLAVLNGNQLEASTVRAHWDNGSHKLVDENGDPADDPENWVLLTQDGRLAYASGTLAELPDTTDWTALLENWFLLDANGDNASIIGTSEFRYRGNYITLVDVNQYGVRNDNLGGNDKDIYVLRLMPVWEPIDNPFHYKVALNWVDAQGELYTKYFDDYWQEVLTDWKLSDGNLTVQIIKNATPFLNWIAQNPTYTFWDAVNENNALFRYHQDHQGEEDEPNFDQQARDAMRAEMARAITEFIPTLHEGTEQYNKVLEALCTRDIGGTDENGNPVKNGDGNDIDDFWRLGNYAYQVFEDYATIVVWMYEDKGGLVFRKEVDKEPFIPDDEFYFTISNVTVSNTMVGGNQGTLLNNTYKAYPEVCYNPDGTVRPTLDSDAWLVTFKDGKIASIVKNDGESHEPVTYFTLQHGEGIMLYVPAGEYTITELGSKSGGAYRVNVAYDGNSTPSLNSSWTLPDGILWLKGKEKRYYEPNTAPAGVSQVSATVYFGVGEKNLVHTLQFNNMTATLSIEKDLGANEEDKDAFNRWLAENANRRYRFAASLDLPYGYTPIAGVKVDSEGHKIEGSEYYYFHVNVYNANGSLAGTRELVLTPENNTSNTWTGEIDLLAGQRAAIVMTAPDDGHTLYAYTPDGLKEITSSAQIIYVDGVPCYNEPYGEDNSYPPLVYFSGGNVNSGKMITIGSRKQLQFITKYDGDPYLACNDGHALYILVGHNGTEYVFEQLESPAEVNLHANDMYQVLDKKDVPLYYLDDNDVYQLAKMPIQLHEHIDRLYFRYNDDYYPVTLTPSDEENPDGAYIYDDVYTGIYAGEIAMTLKKDFQVFCSINGSDFSGVSSLEEIQVRVDTVDVPVSKEIFNYRFDELWRKAEWKEEEWNSETEKTNLFTERWSNQSGIANTGEEAKAKVVNWYKYLPGKGYLCITEKGGQPGETFIYKITKKDTSEVLFVTVNIGDDGTGATYVYAPAGDYIIEEVTNWAWRYEDGKCVAPNTGTYIATVTITTANDTPQHAVHADYTNKRNDKVWYGGESSKDNRFNAASPGETDQEGTEDSARLAYDLLAVTPGEKKKWDDVVSESE